MEPSAGKLQNVKGDESTLRAMHDNGTPSALCDYSLLAPFAFRSSTAKGWVLRVELLAEDSDAFQIQADALAHLYGTVREERCAEVIDILLVILQILSRECP